MRLLSVDANSPSQFCVASRVPYKLYCQQPAHVFVTCLVIFWRQFDKHSSSCSSVEVRPSNVNQCTPVAISDSTTISASNGVDAYNSGLTCVLYSFATHLAHVGLPWLSLVSLRPSCLDGCLPVSRRHVSLWGRSFTSCDDGCTPLLHVLPWRTASGSSHPPLLSSPCNPSHKLSTSCSS